MKHIWSILSQQTIIDERNNNISLINAIERFNIEIDPQNFKKALESEENIILNLNAELASLWQKEKQKEQGFYKLDWTDPEDNTIATLQNQKIQIDESFARTRTIVRFDNLPFEEARSGTYKLNILYSDKKEGDYNQVAQVPLEVKFQKKE